MREKEIFKRCNKQKINNRIGRFKPKYLVLILNLNGQNSPSDKTRLILIDLKN